MKRFLIAGLVALSCAVVLAVSAPAGQGPGGPGQGPRGGGPRMYDPSKAETVSGEVIAVKEFSSRNGARYGVGLELNTGDRTLSVHLGPRDFISQQTVKITAKDRVEVTGIKTFHRGKEVFIAGEVKKGGEVLKLRDEKGIPLWAGAGPGGVAGN